MLREPEPDEEMRQRVKKRFAENFCRRKDLSVFAEEITLDKGDAVPVVFRLGQCDPGAVPHGNGGEFHNDFKLSFVAKVCSVRKKVPSAFLLLRDPDVFENSFDRRCQPVNISTA